MSFPGKKILGYSLFIAVFTITLLLLASCLSAANIGTEEALPAASYSHAGQALIPAEMEALPDMQDELPALKADKSEPKADPPVENEPSAGPEQASNVGYTLFLPLAGDTKPTIPTVTSDTYVPLIPPAGKPDKPGKPSSKISIPVLNYHSVAIDPGNIVVIPPDKLDAQMAYLHDNGYTPLSLEAFIRLLEGDSSEKAPEKPVLLTFDDGYLDNYEQAMPILAKYGFRATLFVSPGMTEQDGYLTWEQIKKMQAGGWDIQPHGMSHPHLPKLSADEQAYEIGEARKQIEERLGTKADIFCYPYGEHNKTTLKLLKHYGFRYAFTTEQGFATNEQSPYLLKRLFINGEEDLNAFAAKLPKLK